MLYYNNAGQKIYIFIFVHKEYNLLDLSRLKFIKHRIYNLKLKHIELMFPNYTSGKNND